MVNVIVTGVAGRMGGQILRMLRATEGFRLVGALERPGYAGPRDAGEAAGPVADAHGEAREPAVMHQPLLDHPAQDRGVDVAAADHEHDVLAGQFGQEPGHHRGPARS